MAGEEEGHDLEADVGVVEPLAAFAEVGLMATAAADGFMIVPAASEGYPAGATINAYFYGEC